MADLSGGGWKFDPAAARAGADQLAETGVSAEDAGTNLAKGLFDAGLLVFRDDSPPLELEDLPDGGLQPPGAPDPRT
jgi:hypothetical protein